MSLATPFNTTATVPTPRAILGTSAKIMRMKPSGLPKAATTVGAWAKTFAVPIGIFGFGTPFTGSEGNLLIQGLETNPNRFGLVKAAKDSNLQIEGSNPNAAIHYKPSKVRLAEPIHHKTTGNYWG
jgi:hypothetical protein